MDTNFYLQGTLQANYVHTRVEFIYVFFLPQNTIANLPQTSELGGVPMLIRSADMSNTIPDQKITATFLTYLAARLLDLSAEMTAARTIQLFWRRYSANKKEKQFKVKYTIQSTGAK